MTVVDLSTILPPVDVDPDSDLGRMFATHGYEPNTTRHAVMGTRRLALLVVALLPPPPVVLDFADVEVVSTPFVDELLLQRPDVTAANLNDDAADVWQLVTERMAKG